MTQEAFFIKHKFPTFTDERGSLSVLDKLDQLVSWQIKRSYWISDVKTARGAHCVKGERKLYIMAKGSCLFKIYDGQNWYEITLNSPGEAIEFRSDLWRELENFSDDAVMFTLCNLYYDKSKYIFDIKEFEQYIKDNK